MTSEARYVLRFGINGSNYVYYFIWNIAFISYKTEKCFHPWWELKPRPPIQLSSVWQKLRKTFKFHVCVQLNSTWMSLSGAWPWENVILNTYTLLWRLNGNSLPQLNRVAVQTSTTWMSKNCKYQLHFLIQSCSVSLNLSTVCQS